MSYAPVSTKFVGFEETKTAEATLQAANWANVHARGGEIPAIREKYARKEVPERMIGSCEGDQSEYQNAYF